MPREFKKTDIEILDQTVRYQGFLSVHDYKVRYRQFDGSLSPVAHREILHKTPAVGVLPYDPQTNQVVLIEQLRLGALEDSISPWLLEIVAGLIDTDETETEVAIRETYEETGLVVKELTPICQYWTSPGSSNEKFSLYCAEVDAKHDGEIFGLAEEAENIRVHVVDVAQALAWVKQGLLSNAPSIIALQWLGMEIYRNA